MEEGQGNHTGQIHFDKMALLEKISGKEKTYLRLIQVSLETIPDYLTKIGLAISNNNPVEIADLAHTLKGAAATMCFTYLEKLAFSLEKQGLTHDQMVQLHQEMLIEFEIIKELLV